MYLSHYFDIAYSYFDLRASKDYNHRPCYNVLVRNYFNFGINFYCFQTTFKCINQNIWQGVGYFIDLVLLNNVAALIITKLVE